MTYRILALACLLLSSLLNAKEVKLFKSFGLDNPMSHQFVRTIAQDQDGFMWFGSHEGLHRFDGHQIRSFHHDPNVTNSLSSDVVSKILIDSQHRLWVATSGAGLNLFRSEQQDFLHLGVENVDSPLTNNVINVLFEDSTGQLWVGTENGLNILNNSENRWQVKQVRQILGNPNSLSHNTVHAIMETNDNQIWVGTNGGGVSVFDLKGQFVRHVKLGESGSSTYLNKFVNALYSGENGTVWIGTIDQGLIQYDITSRQYKHYQSNEADPFSITSNTIQAIYRDSKAQLWVATDKGLLIHNKEADHFFRFNHSPTNPYSLSNDYILSFFEDDNQMMWIGTFSGVNRWDANMTTFSQYSSQTNEVMTNNNVTSFTQSESGHVIFSTYSGGLYQLSVTDNRIERLDKDGYFSKYRVMTLLADNNTLWIGTRGSGLFEFDLASSEIRHFEHDRNNLNTISANSITDIIKDKNDHIWVSTFHQGINLMLPGGEFKRYPQNSQQPQLGPSSNHVLQLLQGTQGDIWLATYGGGLNRFNVTSQHFTHIKATPQDSQSLSSDTAWILFEDKQNNLWVGTQAAGFNILSDENRRQKRYQFTHLDTKNGLKSRTVYGIEQDGIGNIWFSTNKGISRFSVNKGSVKHFDLTHGLIDLEYNHGAIFKDANNTLYFGTGKGFTSVNPDQLYQNSKAPEVRLTNIFKLNEPMVFNRPLSEIHELELEHFDQLISFEYVGLNYSNPESTQYRYRLVGFDEQWIEAGTSRRATYTNLPAGQYQLELVAGNSDNVWSSPGLQLRIVVNPAPWNTWWAYLLYAGTIALLLLTYSRFMNRKLVAEQEQKQLLKQQVAEKTEKFQQKNTELELANKQLENAATTDKVTGVKSRRYLDIYIEQATQLMSQIHQNILPVQRNILPRLYLFMVRVRNVEKCSNSQLVDLTELLLYTRNEEDLVIRWSGNTFAIIGYEKDDNVRELAVKLTSRLGQVVSTSELDMAYSFYPFDFEQPMALSWDQVSVLTEYGLKMVEEQTSLNWLGIYSPLSYPFNYLEVLQQKQPEELNKLVKVKKG